MSADTSELDRNLNMCLDRNLRTKIFYPMLRQMLYSLQRVHNRVYLMTRTMERPQFVLSNSCELSFHTTPSWRSF